MLIEHFMEGCVVYLAYRQKRYIISGSVAAVALALGLPFGLTAAASVPVVYMTGRELIEQVWIWRRTANAKRQMKANPRAVEEMRTALSRANPQYSRRQINHLIQDAFYDDLD